MRSGLRVLIPRSLSWLAFRHASPTYSLNVSSTFASTPTKRLLLEAVSPQIPRSWTRPLPYRSNLISHSGVSLWKSTGLPRTEGDTLLKFVRASLVHNKIGDGVGAASRFPVLGLVERLPVVQAGQWVAVGGFYSHIPSLSLPLLLRHQRLVQTIPRSGWVRFTRGNRAPTARGLG